MSFIVKSDPFATNIQRINFVLEMADTQVDTYTGFVEGVFAKNANTKEETSNTNRESDKATDMCRLGVKVKTLRKIVDNLKDTTEVLNDCMQYVVNYELTPANEYVMKKIQTIALRVKRLMIDVSIKISKTMKAMMLALNNKCGCPATAALSAAVLAIMAVFKALALAIYAVLMAVKFILDIMPAMISVGAENMCFFMTPKSIMFGLTRVAMTCANPNGSICNRLPTVLKLGISSIEEAINIANNITRILMIASGAALGLACAFTKFVIPDNLCKSLKVINPNAIIKAIDLFLSLIPLPNALPKYEKLVPWNLGYLAWLIIGFCPGGKKAFGFPGFP
jgi:hypothetical protein